jgi:hypothetical protein
MFRPYAPPGSCVNVFALYMGFVPHTARQDATPASDERKR